eukprot:TRINITY_DN6616_c3_g1_i1.p1 TRINITY_DN6616_c3_g1~~TRINITY_DN6616_c3_g1_i1.p1  ORF type:complete len:431 (+),score=10.51 TRINITY_DN6616_c3_g1_i1:27-1295(+)
MKNKQATKQERNHDGQHGVWSKTQITKWRQVNEMYVDDVKLEIFYKPHTVFLMVVTLGVLVIAAMGENSNGTHGNVIHGLAAVGIAFLMFSMVALPNGPFVRPHPAVWRCVLGVSIVYWLLLIFMLFQSKSDTRGAMEWVLGAPIPYTSPEDSPEYSADCALTVNNVWSRVDVFILCHSLGWVAKALMLRSVWLCWLLSIAWEITEVVFSPVLPNFSECWWDQLVLDILICNGVGIYIGSKLCRFLECRTYNWDTIRDVPSLTGKVKRAALQFTPSEWVTVQWDPFSSTKRTFSVLIVCFFVLLTELSTFFLKHIFMIPTSHRFNFVRILIWVVFGLPSLRQVYIYVTDRDVKRIGTQAWVACAILFTELLICIKHGKDQFDRPVFLKAFVIWSGMTVGVTAMWLVFTENSVNTGEKGKGRG